MASSRVRRSAAGRLWAASRWGRACCATELMSSPPRSSWEKDAALGARPVTWRRLTDAAQLIPFDEVDPAPELVRAATLPGHDGIEATQDFLVIKEWNLL